RRAAGNRSRAADRAPAITAAAGFGTPRHSTWSGSFRWAFPACSRLNCPGRERITLMWRQVFRCSPPLTAGERGTKQDNLPPLPYIFLEAPALETLNATASRPSAAGRTARQTRGAHSAHVQCHRAEL